MVKDDRIDAVAMAVYYWLEQMDRDATKATQTHEQRQLEKQLDEFRRRYAKLSGGPRAKTMGARAALSRASGRRR